MALAGAVLSRYQFKGTLRDFVKSDFAQTLKVLEINEAGGLTPTLSQLPGHLIVNYPEYDMTKLPFDRDSFDLVLHSDTLEHVVDPIAGLAECKAILNESGACIYTVPIIVGRLSRSRKELKASFHGSNQNNDLDQLVHTEFGADAWQWPIFAGFKTTTIYAFEYPAALAILAE
jgi:SAM-dependent methyltransferase